MRLFAIPYAFGNSCIFYPLEKEMDIDIELVPVDYSGHFMRHSEPLYYTINDMALDIYNQIADKLCQDYALLGYSMGGFVAYELFNIIKKYDKPLPKHILIFGSNEPDFNFLKADYESFNLLQIKDFLSDFKGTSQEVLENDEMLKILSPIVKSDCIALRDYVPDITKKITVPVTVLRGENEKDRDNCQKGWEKFCSAGLDYEVVTGGHFFMFEENGKRMAEYAEKIKNIILRKC